MPNYHRYRIENTPIFITLTTANRQPLLIDNIVFFRHAIQKVKKSHPFKITSFVLLPDHCHFIMELPNKDVDFSVRINQIKGIFSRFVIDGIKPNESRMKRRERGVWQRRFWDHMICDQDDYSNHINYIHYNPVKRGYVNSTKDWLHSSFHHFVRNNVYPENWRENDIVLHKILKIQASEITDNTVCRAKNAWHTLRLFL